MQKVHFKFWFYCCTVCCFLIDQFGLLILTIKYGEVILDIHSASYLLNADGSGALSLVRSWNSLLLTGVVCQQVSRSLHVPYMFSTCWRQNLQFIEFVFEVPQPDELSQPLLTESSHLFRPQLFPQSHQIRYQVSWGERWCFAIVYKMRPHDSCDNEAEAQIKAKIPGYKYRNRHSTTQSSWLKEQTCLASCTIKI